MPISQNALTVLSRRYLRKDKNGNPIETPEEMFRRVASCVASVEKTPEKRSLYEEKFLSLMTSLEFLPNSPTLMNAGRPLSQLAACFVLPVEDSIESIFEAVKDTAIIHQSGGGTGFSFSRLRPANDMVETTGGVASGPVSFMRVFNAATEAIKQGGTRRGANMGVLSVHHPDIIAFIKAKTDPAEFTNFNLSVAITDEFMAALKNKTQFELKNPRSGEVTGLINASEVFTLISECAASTGEPGLLFIDRINAHNPTPKLGRIEATNPCGEQPLLPYEACNLGSINLSKMLKRTGRKYEIDRDKLRSTTRLAVRFLDNVIDACQYPLPKIETITRANRKIGLGIMGFADMLIKLEVSYSSNEALKTANDVMSLIKQEAQQTSMEIASEKGPFQNFDRSIYSSGRPLRNATLTTIAPTGTLSIIAGCSSGIEPLYAISYIRKALDGVELKEFTPLLKDTLENHGVKNIEAIINAAIAGKKLSSIDEVPAAISALFETAFDIPPETHVRVQAAFQEHTDNAVSKTINLPSTGTDADATKAFLLAYELGCKGITVYRTGSRSAEVLSCKETLYC